MTEPPVDRWVCQVCKARFVVPTLAREQKHRVRASKGD